MKKLAAIIAAVGLSLCSLTGCAQSGVKNSAQATAENPMILTLAHGLSETHTVHIAMTEFADKVKERTNGRIQIQIFPNGQLDIQLSRKLLKQYPNKVNFTVASQTLLNIGNNIPMTGVNAGWK